jgi:predicted metal-binding membrane protein
VEAETTERSIQRDKAVLIGAVAAVVAASWLYLWHGAGMDMQSMTLGAMPTLGVNWTASYAALMFAMWAVMMVAMMLPSAAPMFLLHATLARRRESSTGLPRSLGFALGYVAVWLGFSLAATALQWSLDRAAVFSPAMLITNTSLVGAVLIGAGIYQWTPLKQTCLHRCRSPLDFVLTYWRDGVRGAFDMGLRHGAYCLACCWMLMLLLFVGGLMNLVWIVGIAAFVIIEKVAPAGHWLSKTAGAALVVWGGIVLSTAL